MHLTSASFESSTDSFYHRRHISVEVSRFDTLQRKGKLVCVIRWVSAVKNFTGVVFELSVMMMIDHHG